jgi:hypothetical protein
MARSFGCREHQIRADLAACILPLVSLAFDSAWTRSQGMINGEMLIAFVDSAPWHSITAHSLSDKGLRHRDGGSHYRPVH